jgi:very-short-patch-repair endonuclease
VLQLFFRIRSHDTFMVGVRTIWSYDEAWRTLASRAEKQCGLITQHDLSDAGVPRHVLAAWVRMGRLVKVAPRVWRIAGVPESWEQRLLMGLLSLGGDACVSHDAAAQLHGFDRAPRDRVEFTVLRRSRSPRLPAGVHSTRRLPAIDVVRIRGMRTTSATRTIIDLARARVEERRLEASIDSAVRSGASAPTVLYRRLADLRGPGRWGCRLLDDLLVDSGGETILERDFLSVIRAAGLPRPKTQRPFRDDQRTYARVDFLFEPFPIVVEVSGRRGHVSDAERERDAQRRNELQDVGLRVYEYTYRHVTQRPGWVATTMRERLITAGWDPSAA